MADAKRSFNSGREPQPRFVIEREGPDGRMVPESTASIDPATGEVVQGADGLMCEPGHEFGEYVRRALPRSFLTSLEGGPSWREIRDLWAGRALKLLRAADGQWEDDWRVAALRQSYKGMPDPNCRWALTIHRSSCAADTLAAEQAQQSPAATGGNSEDGAEPQGAEPLLLAKDTTVMIDGLRGAPEHNRRVGQIKGYNAEKGRYIVRYRQSTESAAPEDPAAAITVNVRATNIFVCEKHKLCRVNVRGGGTLGNPWRTRASEYEPPDAQSKLISFRWVDKALPEIDLEDGVSCPNCRQIEPARAGYAPAEKSQLRHGECPICLETSDACLQLNCGHMVCDLCWRRWSAQKCGDGAQLEAMMEDIEINEAKLIAAREEAAATFTAMNGKVPLAQMARPLLKDSGDCSTTGLIRFKKALLVQPIALVASDQIKRYFRESASATATEVYVEVLSTRTECMLTFLNSQVEAGSLSIAQFGCSTVEEAADYMMGTTLIAICQRIGELYEAAQNFRGAIPWYKRCVGYATGVDRQTTLHNLGLAQKNAGQLREALSSYEAAELAEGGAGHVEHHLAPSKCTLEKEIRQWKGPCDELPPGECIGHSAR
jgi:hypothetical protein